MFQKYVLMAHQLLQYDSVKLNAKPTPVCCVTATQIRALPQLLGITRLENRSVVVAVHDMRGYGTVEVQFHTFSTSALDGGVRGQQHTPVALPTAKEVSVTNV
jgi:hypothetical protein